MAIIDKESKEYIKLEVDNSTPTSLDSVITYSSKEEREIEKHFPEILPIVQEQIDIVNNRLDSYTEACPEIDEDIQFLYELMDLKRFLIEERFFSEKMNDTLKKIGITNITLIPINKSTMKFNIEADNLENAYTKFKTENYQNETIDDL
mgnify:CR=1 FL=1